MSARGFQNFAFCGYTDSTGGSSPGSQGDDAPSYLSLEEEDQATQILSLVDREGSRAQFDREWETGGEEILSSSSSPPQLLSSSDHSDSTVSSVDTDDGRDNTLGRAGMFRQWVVV